MADRVECTHPANGLLAWYLNGTLEGEEQAVVREHLNVCPVCAREIDALSMVSRGLRSADVEYPILDGGVPEPPGEPLTKSPSIRRVRLPLALAAGLTLPAALGMWWAILGFPGAGGEPAAPAPSPQILEPAPFGPTGGTPPTAPRPDRDSPGRGSSSDVLLGQAVLVDLRDGLRGAGTSAPEVKVPPEAQSVAIRFSVPVNPDARHAVALHGPAGLMLEIEARVLMLDEMGRSVITIAADALRTSGTYDLIVAEAGASGEPTREFRFTFRIGTPAAGPRD